MNVVAVVMFAVIFVVSVVSLFLGNCIYER